MITPLSPSSGAMGLRNHSYVYTDKLLALEARGTPVVQPAQPIVGFLPLAAWEPFLRSHPDQRLAAFLRRGISFGFRIGCSRSQELKQQDGNLQSVAKNPEVVSRYIEKELAQGKLRRLEPAEVSAVHKSPIGFIPKAGQPGKFRLIVDLSSPVQFSVNDGIPRDLCSLEYASVDQAVSMVASLGVGAQMAKLDLRSAYRMVPVHPADQQLLGIEWEGVSYCDLALPFGLRSAPLIFTAVADGLAWALWSRGVKSCLHYLDDFFFCGLPATRDCAAALEVAIPMCLELGLPVAPEKVEGPSSTLTFLGIEIDSVAREIRLPRSKLLRLQETLATWAGKKNATKHQLQCLIGQLNHAASVVRPGRTFLQHLIDTMKIPKLSWQRVRLNTQCRSDIQWWASFLVSWNGIAFFPDSLQGGHTLVSDASGSWGCGAFVGESLEWFQLKWPGAWADMHIAAKELYPIVIGAAVWGSRWTGSQVLFLCDNQAVVSALSSRAVRDPMLMYLIRCLFFVEAHFKFDHAARHIAGKRNAAADALSRDHLESFLTLYPAAPRVPKAIPTQLQSLLSDTSLSWTSPTWRGLLNESLRIVS